VTPLGHYDFLTGLVTATVTPAAATTLEVGVLGRQCAATVGALMKGAKTILAFAQEGGLLLVHGDASLTK